MNGKHGEGGGGWAKFHPATDYLVCPTMKLTTLEHVVKALETLQPEMRVDDRIRLKARTALDAMLGKT